MSSNRIVRLGVATVTVALLLSGCNKPDETVIVPATETATVEHVQNVEVVHDHDHDHDHDHHHDDGEMYTCQDGKMVMIAVHNHEGEMEAHATIDDITYDLHPDAATPNQYISHEDGIGGQAMVLTLNDNQAVITSLADNSVLLTCQK